MVGGDAGGTSIGVAPGAKWIAAKIFDDQGSATTSGIHAAFQWLLDPDGNPATPDAPNVVEGSWTMNNPGCDLSFEPDLEALRSAGILPVFAAGNSGPATGTSYSPANNPAGFAVGATDNSDVIGSFSSEGPSACTGDQPIFPDVTAPGVNIFSALGDTTSSYQSLSGTSMASPCVAGAAALILSMRPDITPGSLKELLKRSAYVTPEQTALGASFPGTDSTYNIKWGFGLLDVYQAGVNLANGIADITFTACVGDASPCPGGNCQISGGRPDWANDSDILLATDPPVQSQPNTITVNVQNRTAALAESDNV
jgi:subtilisin family serine protease